MTTSLVVPWRGNGGERERLWEFCRQEWEHSGLVDEIVECDSGQDPFTRGTSINQGVAEAKGDELILADADTFVSGAFPGLSILRAGAAWVIAYGSHRYYRVSPDTTEALLARERSAKREPTAGEFLERCLSYSGCVMIRRPDYEEVGGYPETLIGWGFEDNCLQHALDTLVGHHARVAGFAVQLYHHHIEADRFEQPNIRRNWAVSDEYAAASGNPEKMRRVIFEQLGVTIADQALTDAVPEALDALIADKYRRRHA